MFWAYAKHEQEKEDIIQQIVDAALNGEHTFTIDLDDSFSNAEIKEMEEEVCRRINGD